MTFGVPFAQNATLAQKASAFTGTTELADFMRAAFPDSGVYWLECDYNEPNWQLQSWGAPNYARLLSIKQAYDPNNMFMCHHCVGDTSN